jgi:carbamoyl-phosphate synthase large subunit
VLEVNPARQPHRAFRQQDHRCSAGEARRQGHGGKTLKELGFTEEVHPKHFSVKEAVFPFNRFPGIDIVLGPEMKSTGEVMGIDRNLGLAYAKSQMAAQPPLPKSGNIFISVADRQKPRITELARGFVELGFSLYATSGTAAALKAAGVP